MNKSDFENYYEDLWCCAMDAYLRNERLLREEKKMMEKDVNQNFAENEEFERRVKEVYDLLLNGHESKSKKNPTNADTIRSATDEELAAWMYDLQKRMFVAFLVCLHVDLSKVNEIEEQFPSMPPSEIMDWLTAPASEESDLKVPKFEKGSNENHD